MALQLNTVRIAGNLGADPKVRTTDSGKLVCNLRVATNEYAGKDDAGQSRYHTEWHSVVLWSQLADFARDLEKGDGVYIEGALRTRSYDDRDGNKRSVTEIRAERIQRTTSTPSGADAHADDVPAPAEEEVF